MAKQLKNLIGGKWLNQRADRKYQIINPTDGKSVVVERRFGIGKTPSVWGRK